MPVVPPTPRFKIETTETNATRFIVPSRKNWFTIFFLGFWLTGWAFGEIMVLGIMATSIFGAVAGKAPNATTGLLGVSGFLLFWLAGWTVGGGFVIYTFFWQVAGKEVIEVSASGITIANKIFSFSRPKEFDSQYVKDLRVSQPADSMWSPWGRAGQFWGRGQGIIAFDYGAKTYRFGSGLDEAEAKMILSEIAQRCPQYLPRASQPGT